MRLYTYSYYKGKSRSRTVGRILVIVLLIVAIFSSFLILGNLLSRRLREAAPLYEVAEAAYGTSSPSAAAPIEVIRRTPTAESLFLTALDPAVYGENGQNIAEACAIIAQLYDGITVTVSAPGSLLCALSSYGENAPGVPLETLRHVAKTAASASLGTAALLNWQGNEIDAAAALELASLGFTEILFTEAVTDSLTKERTDALLALARDVRALSPATRIGFTLTPDILRDGVSAMHLDSLADGADFLALDTGETAGDSTALTALLDSFSGSIAYYPLRILLSGDDVSLATQTEIARQGGISAVMARRLH